MDHLRAVLGEDTLSALQKSRVLMVGAGGIGCELLKNLVLTGYGEIHIVDLDTVTLSNLNRQFLFRKSDIDASKALTVARAVESFNYFGAKLVAHHGNIMDSAQFPADWWRQFQYVFNALDNIEARRHVNRMCLFLRTPLMESGTTGFDGQIQPIYPYLTECFECSAKETPKTFPVCTIRSTPSQPVHCITWAKEFLFKQLFDEPEEGGYAGAQDATDAAEIAHMKHESSELADLRAMGHGFVPALMQKIYVEDIERLLRIDSLWKSRTRPTPLQYNLGRVDSLTSVAPDTQVWDVSENVWVLQKSAASLKTRLRTEKSISFDKDDEDTLDFVCAAANLRSVVFGIPPKSKFDIKQIAGNIIPAIATTNAIVSGFSCMYGTRFFECGNAESAVENSATTFISIKPNKYVTSANLVRPNESCPASSLVARGMVQISPKRTLGWFVDSIAEKYGYDTGGVSVITEKSRLVYDADFDDNWDRPLADLPGFADGNVVLVQDEDDVWESLEVYVREVDEGKEEFPDIKLRRKKEQKERGEGIDKGIEGVDKEIQEVGIEEVGEIEEVGIEEVEGVEVEEIEEIEGEEAVESDKKRRRKQ